MTPIHLKLLLAFLGIALAAPLRAQESLLPADRPIGEVVDHYLAARLKEKTVMPSPPAGDATIARRLYLDLIGRVPTAAEAKAYSGSKESDKKAKLIDALIASPGYARHQANEFDALLAYDNPDAPSVQGYLLRAFQEKRPWDRMFRDLIGVSPDSGKTRETAPPPKGKPAVPDTDVPEAFVLKRLKDGDMLARDISSVFFGLNVTCAQCHKHPYISSLTQDYFFGMKAFFSRSHDFGGTLIERQYALASSFKAKAGKLHAIVPMFLSGQKIETKELPEEQNKKAYLDETKKLQEILKAKKTPPLAELNLRAKFADLALDDANRDRFARSIVNRLFHRFYGNGLVMRLDQMHAENDPSHPELLAWLSRDFIEHKYDLSRLIRGLVSSKAYARNSRWNGNEPPPPELFAVAAIRPLTRMQWGVSHRIVSDPSRLAVGETDELRKALELEATKSFGKLIEQPREDFQIGIGESMKLSNDPTLLKLTGDKLAAALAKLPRQQQIEEAVWTVWSRAPAADEIRILNDFLEERKSRPIDAVQQMIWALVNSSEFRFNY